MKIKYVAQRSDKKIEYQFNGEVITATMNDTTDTFDFSSFPEGKSENIETTLPINPIISAERTNGELKVELLYYHGKNASHEERFAMAGDLIMAKIEWKSQTDIEAEKQLELLEPNQKEVKQAELQVTMLNILMEVGLL